MMVRPGVVCLACFIVLSGLADGWVLLASSVGFKKFGTGGGWNLVVRVGIFDGVLRIVEALCLGAGLLLLFDIHRRVSIASR